MSEIDDLENLHTEVSTTKEGAAAGRARWGVKLARWRRYSGNRTVFRGRKRRLPITLAPVAGARP